MAGYSYTGKLACMHGGFRIVRPNLAYKPQFKWNIKILEVTDTMSKKAWLLFAQGKTEFTEKYCDRKMQ